MFHAELQQISAISEGKRQRDASTATTASGGESVLSDSAYIGVLVATQSASLSLSDTSCNSNHVVRGAAVVVEQGASASLSQSEFSHNHGLYGGALLTDGGENVDVMGCSFVANSCGGACQIPFTIIVKLCTGYDNVHRYAHSPFNIIYRFHTFLLGETFVLV